MPRSTLQQMAAAGELSTFDGEVELGEVLRVFPDIAIEDNTEIRRVEEIKAAAVSKSPPAQHLPDPVALEQRLRALGRDFARAKVSADHYEMAHGWLAGRISELVEEGRLRADAGDDLMDWFRRQIALDPGDRARRERLIAQESQLRVMTATVTLMPKGRSFDVEGRETILEAGLRAGLPLAYGCSNGNCADCRARVVSGEVIKVKPHDYVFTREDKANNAILTCAYSAVGDVVLETGTPGPGDIPEQTIVAKVRALDGLGPGVTSLTLLTSRSERLRFLAGQRVRLTVGEQTAELPVASCPCEERRIELHVRGDSEFARAVAALKPNAAVTVTGPHGGFVLDDESTAPLLLIAIGPGFAAMKSLLQQALALEQAPTITLLREADEAGPYQQNLTRSYAESLDHFFCMPVNGDWTAALAEVERVAGPLAAHDVLAAGPTDALESLAALLETAGVDKTRFRSEAVE